MVSDMYGCIFPSEVKKVSPTLSFFCCFKEISVLNLNEIICKLEIEGEDSQ